MLAIVIVAALSFVGVIGYVLYLTPGPKDQI
jgi:preprotein translocase subunit Sss1